MVKNNLCTQKNLSKKIDFSYESPIIIPIGLDLGLHFSGVPEPKGVNGVLKEKNIHGGRNHG